MSQPFISGRHLRACRTLAGLSQIELATRANLTPRTLRDYEGRGALPPDGFALRGFALAIEAAGVTVTPSGCELRAQSVNS